MDDLNMRFRNDIQGLRAVAVLLVFLFHLNAGYLSGGFIGVDVFFVISGYLISSIILLKKRKDTFNFLEFYLGRFKRIVPVFLVFLTITLLLGSYIFLASDIIGLRKNVFWSILFNSNNYLAQLDNYFGTANSENPLLHTWTLSIEMQFYFLLPFLLIFVPKKHLTSLIVFLIIAFVGYSFYNSTFLNNKSVMYFSLLARIPEFLIGVLFAIKEKQILKAVKTRLNTIAVISFILLIFSAIIYSGRNNFPGILVLVPCLSTGCLLIAYDSSFNKSFLSNKLLVHIGELSYSIYLWHWMIMAFIRYHNQEYDFTFLEVISVTVLSYIFSYFSYRYVENILRKLSNVNFFKIMALPSVFFCFLIINVRTVNRFFSDIPSYYSEPSFGMKSHAQTFEGVEFLGDRSKKDDSILLIGDSHALVYKNFLDQVGKRNGFNFRTITNNRYPNIPGLSSKDFSESRYYKQYHDLVKVTKAQIIKSKVIIISSNWSGKIASLPNSLKTFIENLNDNQLVIFLSDFPTVDKDPLRINRGIKRNIKIKQKYIVKANNALPDYVKNIIDKKSNVRYLKLDYSFLYNELPFIRDTVAYYDSGHLNQYGTTALSKLMEKQFLKEFMLVTNNKILK